MPSCLYAATWSLGSVSGLCVSPGGCDGALTGGAACGWTDQNVGPACTLRTNDGPRKMGHITYPVTIPIWHDVDPKAC